MTHDDEVGSYLPCEISDFQSGLTSHQLRNRIKTQLFQPGNALVEYFREGFFYLNRGSGVGHIGQQRRTGFGEDRQKKNLGAALTCKERTFAKGGAPFHRPS